VVEPVDPDVLAGRRAVILAKRRARRLAKPAYVNTDASWRDGVAGLAYVSGSLGNRTALVACSGSSEAEYLALLMAMEDAARSQLPGLIDFRVDSTAVAHLAVGMSVHLVELRKRVKGLLARHREWRLAFVERKQNWVADGLARRTLKQWQETSALGQTQDSREDRVARARLQDQDHGPPTPHAQ
jgi:Reverse transcriptase-like